MNRGTVTPSKYMSLERLQTIKMDNFVGANGKDYDHNAVLELIAIKKQKQSRKESKKLDTQQDQLETERLRLLSRIAVLKSYKGNAKIKMKLVHELGLQVIPVSRALGTLPQSYSLTKRIIVKCELTRDYECCCGHIGQFKNIKKTLIRARKMIYCPTCKGETNHKIISK